MQWGPDPLHPPPDVGPQLWYREIAYSLGSEGSLPSSRCAHRLCTLALARLVCDSYARALRDGGVEPDDVWPACSRLAEQCAEVEPSLSPLALLPLHSYLRTSKTTAPSFEEAERLITIGFANVTPDSTVVPLITQCAALVPTILTQPQLLDALALATRSTALFRTTEALREQRGSAADRLAAVAAHPRACHDNEVAELVQLLVRASRIAFPKLSFDILGYREPDLEAAIRAQNPALCARLLAHSASYEPRALHLVTTYGSTSLGWTEGVVRASRRPFRQGDFDDFAAIVKCVTGARATDTASDIASRCVGRDYTEVAMGALQEETIAQSTLSPVYGQSVSPGWVYETRSAGFRCAARLQRQMTETLPLNVLRDTLGIVPPTVARAAVHEINQGPYDAHQVIDRLVAVCGGRCSARPFRERLRVALDAWVDTLPNTLVSADQVRHIVLRVLSGCQFAGMGSLPLCRGRVAFVTPATARLVSVMMARDPSHFGESDAGIDATEEDADSGSERGSVDETDVDETDVDETDVDETDVDETDVDETDVDETDAGDLEAESSDLVPLGVDEAALLQTGALHYPPYEVSVPPAACMDCVAVYMTIGPENDGKLFSTREDELQVWAGLLRALAPTRDLLCTTPLARVLEVLYNGPEMAFYVLEDRAATSAGLDETDALLQTLPDAELDALVRQYVDTGRISWEVVDEQAKLAEALESEKMRLSSTTHAQIPLAPVEITSGLRVAVRTAPNKVFVVKTPPTGTGVASLVYEDEPHTPPVQVAEHDVLRLAVPITDERAMEHATYRELWERKRHALIAALRPVMAQTMRPIVRHMVEHMAKQEHDKVRAHAAGVEALCACAYVRCTQIALEHESVRSVVEKGRMWIQAGGQEARSTPLFQIQRRERNVPLAMIRRGIHEYRRCARASALAVEGAIAAAASAETDLEDAILRSEPVALGRGATLGAEQIALIARSAPMHQIRARTIESFASDELRAMAAAIAFDTGVASDAVFQLLDRVASRARDRRRALEFFQDPGELPETLRAAALYGHDDEAEYIDKPAHRSVARQTIVALRALQRGGDPPVRDLGCEIAAAYAVLLAPPSMHSAAGRAARTLRNPTVVEALQVPSMHSVLGLEDALYNTELRSFSRELVRARERCDVLALASQRHGYEWSFDDRYAGVSTESDVPPWAEALRTRRDFIREGALRSDADQTMRVLIARAWADLCSARRAYYNAVSRCMRQGATAAVLATVRKYRELLE